MKNPTELLKSAAIIMLLPLVTICTATTSRPRRFEPIATYKGPGAIEDAIIGPGPTPDAELLYRSYMYVDRTLDLVAVDPGTGRWRVFGLCGIKCVKGRRKRGRLRTPEVI